MCGAGRCGCWGRGAIIQLMSTFPFFIFFRCSVASICLLRAAFCSSSLALLTLGLPLMEDMCIHCVFSRVFMPEIQSGIALEKTEREVGKFVCV